MTAEHGTHKAGSLLPSECPNCGRLHKGYDFNQTPGPIQMRLRQSEERLRRLAALFRVPDGGRYMNDWRERAERLQETDRAFQR